MRLNNYLRKASFQEELLLEFLIEKASTNISNNWKSQLLVASMNDGEMGSLYLYPTQDSISNQRKFGSQVSECQFKDKDGIMVSASLNVDTQNLLFELDIWKVDFSKLIRLPISKDLFF